MLEYATLMKQMAQFIRLQGKHLFLIIEMNLNICQQKLKICRLYDSQGVFLLHDDHLPLDPNLLLRRRGYQPLLQRCCLVLLAKTVFSFKVHHYSNLHPMNRKKTSSPLSDEQKVYQKGKFSFFPSTKDLWKVWLSTLWSFNQIKTMTLLIVWVRGYEVLVC